MKFKVQKGCNILTADTCWSQSRPMAIFICLISRKLRLTAFLTNTWKASRYVQKLSKLSKRNVFTCGEKCYKIASEDRPNEVKT